MAYEPIWDRDPSSLNKMELLKLEKDGLDVIRTIIENYAVQGYDAIPEDELNRFKWAGVYEQKPKEGYFMMRVRINSGIMTSGQAHALARIAKDYGRDLVDVTTRQAIQFHWLTVEQLPDIFRRLEEVGLYSFEACGDCPRTIVGNPLAGIDPDELFDTTALVNEVNDFFLLNKDFSNLPRKYKMSISANLYNSGHAEIQCLAFTPAVNQIDGEELLGFHVWVGGGLSAKPHLAKQLDVFIRPENVLNVAIGVSTIFRDYGYRQKRHHARLKFLVADWGPEKFLEKLTELIGELPTRGEDKTLGWKASYFDGVHPQKQAGYNYVGLNVPVGRLSGTDLEELARLADEYGKGSIRTTVSQNILLPYIPDGKVEQLLNEPVLKRLTPFPKHFMSRTVSCTGNEFCNLAIVETKERAKRVAEYLDTHIELDKEVRIHFIGCPNACGQKHIADIGLQGTLVKTQEGMVDAFDIAVGGILGPGATFNERLKGRVKGDDVGPVLVRLITFFKENRKKEETFHQFYKRVGISPFQEQLDQALTQMV
ncbi:ferredoxin--nitrite reductase NirA [Paenibacillus larvae subsp. larvae]|uniref:Nitrite/sulfite reductase n=2 Tax=Paenibacillus larvae TaxID=1464 RepID=A0AAP5N323_9BACL|nr:sulfite reductase subunit beta [Paenibacillus larvae]AQR78591.1 ferredoxin--nitrite reductase [Paenibacillus larvae subsp. larvae]AVF20155.1 ferredoxin--nitrite reductase NirA [Paenibacillus larvae subsp. larvae]ETK29247.1 ferredoxin--nitrite reductase NirA [Paenibacillus larvae subsp. larvae DSM 25719]MCY7475613.1 nitrite/sulfite reductase [Paenibacillus larvae]MCY7489140.1 nitrite/sulfite reductase [Paenibacillus larvae]